MTIQPSTLPMDGIQEPHRCWQKIHPRQHQQHVPKGHHGQECGPCPHYHQKDPRLPFPKLWKHNTL